MSLPAVTTQRIEALLKQEEINYDLDDDGDVRAGWINVMIWQRVSEERWGFTAVWRGRIFNAEEIRAAMEFCNDFNANRNGPKVYLHEVEDPESPSGRRAHLRMEANYWVEHGMSDEQMTEYTRISLGQIMSCLEEFEAEFSHLVTWSEEE